jgi:nitrile hydratase
MDEVLPTRYHLHIPHDPRDTSEISLAEEDIHPFEKQIIAIHNLMRLKNQLPGLDPIRRAGEEVDGMFFNQIFPETIPESIQNRLPSYGERRVLAVESVLCEMGILSRDELASAQHTPQDPQRQEPAPTVNSSAMAPSTTSPSDGYQPTIDLETFKAPQFQPGEQVRVISEAKPGHIRTPIYLLGKPGVIIRLQGLFLNPEDIAHYHSTVYMLPLYLVEFKLQDVWEGHSRHCNPNDTIRVEIYEPWLSKA